MTERIKKDWFGEVEQIISEPLKFKAKLAIGENAYTSLKVKNALFWGWDLAGVIFAGGGIARSSLVASKFFAPKGFWAILGFGTATTPVGWLMLAGLMAGGAWLGITHYLKQTVKDRVTVIPKFLNTPLDVLSLGLFDLMAPLALKIAEVDSEMHPKEREHIINYFVREWGYDQKFVEVGIEFTENKLIDYTIKGLAQKLAEFQKINPDCNYNSMSQEIILFLQNIIESDSRIDEREELALEKVENIFEEVGRINLGKKSMSCIKAFTSSASNLLGKK